MKISQWYRTYKDNYWKTLKSGQPEGGRGNLIERFSFECRKTKTKVITQDLANHKGHR